MIIFDWVIVGIVVAGLIVIGVLLGRNWKRLLLIDTEAMPKAKVKSKKYELIEGRLLRKGQSMRESLKGRFGPLGEKMSAWYRGLLDRLVILERKYRHADEAPQTLEEKEKTRQKITALIEEGERLFKEENYGEAEAIFLDVIRLNPKEVEAYEYLGEVYLGKKEYDHAIETLEFARSLNPNEERIHLDLGLVYQSQEQLDKAMEHIREAVELSPNNPRNLNALLQLSLQMGDKFRARETLRRLKLADPDNGKLVELEEQVNGL